MTRYVRPYAADIGNDFVLMIDNARHHRAVHVEDYFESEVLERIEWPAQSPELSPIEHVLGNHGRLVAASSLPPRSLHELEQGLIRARSSLPIEVPENLIISEA